jgi:hypothetical protein
MSHTANIIEFDPDALRGYPPEVRYQTSCSTCGGGYGPITRDEAKAWVRGHDFAISGAKYTGGNTSKTLIAAANKLDRQADAHGEGIHDYTDLLRAWADDQVRWIEGS